VALCVLVVCAGWLVAAAGAEAQTRSDVPARDRAPDGGSGESRAQRYASLKADRVQLRQGPGETYPVAWVFQRAGLPVEVLGEQEVWRQVRDASGTVGWVRQNLLSGRRTALVLPWEVKEGQTEAPLATLRDDDSEWGRAVVQVEAGTLASIITCENAWCRISIGTHRGYIEQAKLWGTYPNETIK
jgi:SH3-like domain-containing protein